MEMLFARGLSAPFITHSLESKRAKTERDRHGGDDLGTYARICDMLTRWRRRHAYTGFIMREHCASYASMGLL